MTFEEFMQKMLAAFPDATVGEDNDGQLVVYTNLTLDPNSDGDKVAPFDDEVMPTCDLCGEPEDQDPTNGREYNWNGETGNHLSCENSVWLHGKFDRPVHTIRGVSNENPDEWNRIADYGVPHDFDCPGCHDIPFTLSPRSETYWSS